MNWYKKAKLIIASMDVYVPGYEPGRYDHVEDVLSLSQTISSMVFYNFIGKMSEEDKEYFQENRLPDTITSDGDSHFNTEGIINVYLRAIPEDKMNSFISAVKYYLGEIDGVEFSGPVIEQSGMYDSPVARFNVNVENISKSDNLPPKLNMANANAYHIFYDVLNFSNNESVFDAWQVINRIDNAPKWKDLSRTPEEKMDPNKNPLEEMRVIDMGYPQETVNSRLQDIREIAQWAIDNGYDKIGIG